MSKVERDILRNILCDLLNGYKYGQDHTWNYYDNEPLRYPYFGSTLYLTSDGNIGFTHFGSSAVKATLKDLEWLITVIFKTTPSGFLHEYIRNDKSAI